MLVAVPIIMLCIVVRWLWSIFTGDHDKAVKLSVELSRNRWWLLFSCVAVIVVAVLYCSPPPKTPCVLGVELGYYFTNVEKILKKKCGNDKLTVHDICLTVDDVYVDGAFFDTVEFWDDDYFVSILPKVGTIRMCKYFYDKSQADEFFKVCKLKHEEEYPKVKGELEKEMRDGLERVILTYKSKRHITAIGKFYEEEKRDGEWCVCLCYINTAES